MRPHHQHHDRGTIRSPDNYTATQPSSFAYRPINSLPQAAFTLSILYPRALSRNELSIKFMSSTDNTTTPHSNFQLIIDALADYADQTGIDLSQNPFVEKLQQSNTPDAILGLLQEREKALKGFCDENRRLINCLGPAVQVLHAFSNVLGEAVSLASHSYLIFLCVAMLMLLHKSIRSPSRRQRPSLSALMFSSPYVPSTRTSIRSHLTHEYSRLRTVSVRTMVFSLISLNA